MLSQKVTSCQRAESKLRPKLELFSTTLCPVFILIEGHGIQELRRTLEVMKLSPVIV